MKYEGKRMVMGLKNQEVVSEIAEVIMYGPLSTMLLLMEEYVSPFSIVRLLGPS